MSLETIVKDIANIKQSVDDKQTTFNDIIDKVRERHNRISQLMGESYSGEIGQCFQMIVQTLEASKQAIGQKAIELENYAEQLDNLRR